MTLGQLQLGFGWSQHHLGGHSDEVACFRMIFYIPPRATPTITLDSRPVNPATHPHHRKDWVHQCRCKTLLYVVHLDNVKCVLNCIVPLQDGWLTPDWLLSLIYAAWVKPCILASRIRFLSIIKPIKGLLALTSRPITQACRLHASARGQNFVSSFHLLIFVDLD
ncbi:hypothetical protein E2C01_005946 [Portunus trituberculatus]|uniref:Uncharacterized protein n=1 Tax=Portunus trituberculatus TaxID=210409 RepID=A0A5B7CU07_PORTR|nr:hypothetical protein [Portunus trituberculatus]